MLLFSAVIDDILGYIYISVNKINIVKLRRDVDESMGRETNLHGRENRLCDFGMLLNIAILALTFLVAIYKVFLASSS